MQTLISDCSQTILRTNPSQPFLIIQLMGGYFLISKACRLKPVQKNIIFQTQIKQFYSTFIRHVNLAYSSKLSDLVDILDIMRKPALQHEWITMYQIHDFKKSKIKNYKISPPVYGAEVIIYSKAGKMQHSIISNLFKLNGQSFYFLSCHPSLIQQLAIITDITGQTIYGVTYFVKEVVICIPFLSICSEKPCAMSISPQIEVPLMRTCYLREGSNYCTGFIIGKGKVISARHLLVLQNQKVGLEVGVRLYPYHQQKKGIISRIGQNSIDLIEITLTDQLASKNSLPMSVPEGKQFSLHLKQEQLVGKQIVALGFGKHGYSPKIFTRIDTVMPTIEIGIVSKMIKLGPSNVFIKTDASLYNGFSGCGIWRQSQLIGMAVFILKNKNSNSNYNRHNFSYTSDFIFRLLKNDTGQQIVNSISNELSLFDRIQTRFNLPLLPKL